jgi:DNA primase
MCSRIVFCFDGDKAGKAAAIRAIQNALPLLRDAREVRIMFLPDGEDPDTMVRKIGAESFNKNVDEAATLFDFLLNHLTAQVDMNTFEGPARLVHLAKPFTQEIADPILKTRFDQRLASLAGLSEQQFSDATRTNESLSQHNHPNKISRNESVRNIDENSGGLNDKTIKPIKIQGKAPFRRAIALLLQNPDALPGANIDWIGKLEEPGAIVFSALAQLIEQNESITTGILIEHWRDKPEEKHLKVLALKDLIISKQQMPAELADILSRLEKEMIVDQCDLLITKSKTQPLSKEEKTSLNSLLQAMSNRG